MFFDKIISIFKKKKYIVKTAPELQEDSFVPIHVLNRRSNAKSLDWAISWTDVSTFGSRHMKYSHR